MRKLFISFLAIFIAIATTSNCQSTDTLIRSIKVKYRQLQQDKNHYKRDSLDLPEQSSEGGTATVWYTCKEVKIINAVYYNEYGKTEVNYYFDSSRLFFVLKKQYTYNVPFYITEKVAKENNTGKFDDKKTRIREQRFYVRA